MWGYIADLGATFGWIGGGYPRSGAFNTVENRHGNAGYLSAGERICLSFKS